MGSKSYDMKYSIVTGQGLYSLEAREEVAGDVPGLGLVDHHEAPVLHSLGEARLVGRVHLNCLHFGNHGGMMGVIICNKLVSSIIVKLRNI